MSQSAEQAFPYVARFIQGYGWIQIGEVDWTRSFISVLDEGGMIWEDGGQYRALDDALTATDAAIAEWVQTVLGERWLGSRPTRRRRSPARASGADRA